MIELFLKGGPLMWPLLVISIVSLAVIIEREVYFIRNRVSDAALLRIKQQVQIGEYLKAEAETASSSRTIMKFLFEIFKNADKTPDIAEKEISLAGDKLLFSASRYIHIQELIGSISPMIGLSGTVLGLVQAFREIGINTAMQIDASLLADGIWVAMITTVAGLFTAIPALIFAHINRTRVKKLAFNMKIYGEELNTLMHAPEAEVR
ncbi:MAG: MotA/TolQ/ExbB proton channel family protein [Spirochaetales bacterium]|uniref:MotA/TolQ/ExbB proton channel family protein n=1 Tax=Candidatus Thalassospirochaeta sargassi TaxID=3119039 RepID=A0AAJ1MPJ7_9SPIO|nr:MotA/TolQ/ExbB proton channel family protein [Spirochaetales bacterium]